MNPTGTYLAVFLGGRTSAKMTAWLALSEAERKPLEEKGMAAWHAWAQKHQAAIVTMGGPLGKTKKITANGIEDTSNAMAAFTVVRADSHEAAARIFEKPPALRDFPGRRRRSHAGVVDTGRLTNSVQRRMGPLTSPLRCAEPLVRAN